MSQSTDGVERVCYSIDELLGMRDLASLAPHVLEKLNAEADLDTACIIRLSGGVSTRARGFSGQSTGLIDITNRRNLRPLAHIQVPQSSETTEQLAMADNNTTQHPQPVQWSLRPRESSDRSSQPHSAPTGFAAQQSENFQRFFRAVRSPTHVRVTAGGRIVPNTRATVPPVLDWNNDRIHNFESRSSPPQADLTSHQPPSWLHNAPIPLGYPPMLPAGFMPSGNYHPQATHATHATLPSPQFNSFGGLEHPSAPQDRKGKAYPEASATAENTPSLPQQVKISHPSQFDTTMPFKLNGKNVYPVPPQFNPQALSMTMLGNPNFMPQAANSMFAPPLPFPLQMASMPNPFMFPGQPHSMPIPTTRAEQVPTMFPFMQPMLPMPFTEMIRAQINSLHGQISIIDSQVASQQLDPNYAQAHRTKLLTDVKNAESLLESQLAAENSIKEAAHREFNSTAAQVSSKYHEDPEIPGAMKRQNLANHPSQSSLRVSSESGLNTPAQKDVEQQKASGPDRAPFPRTDSSSKTRLSAAAAMAPPFQPRSQINTSANSQVEHSLTVYQTSPGYQVEEDDSETDAQIEARLLSKSSTNWGQTFNNTAISVAMPPSLPKAQSMIEPSAQLQSQARSMVRSDTFHGRTDFIASQHPFSNISSHAVPYLVGVLPQGTSTIGANSNDLIYPRPLTDEELRARHLYWGKASVSAQKGLPKFDGKDFYPPSPIKQHTRLAAYGTPQTSPDHESLTSALPDFGQLFTEPGAPGYRTPSPMPISLSHPNSIALSMHNATSNARFGVQDSNHPPSWSKHHVSGKEQVHRPSTPQNNTEATGEEDFSNLFLEPGVPGYKSPAQDYSYSSRLQSSHVSPKFQDLVHQESNSGKHLTHDNDEDDVGSVDSWGAPKEKTAWGTDSQSGPVNSACEGRGFENEGTEGTSVEINLTFQKDGGHSKTDAECSWQERVANFSNADYQREFLQNMLKTPGQTTKSMTGFPVSGTISSATAAGYLPQYRGSAVASLAPTISNVVAQRELEGILAKPHMLRENSISSTFSAENRPLNHSVGAESPNTGAEGYLRSLSRKADGDRKKTIVQGWNSNASGLGTSMTADW